MKKISFLLLTFLLIIVVPVEALSCTTVIITGKATKDGRPLMWKNTDTQNMNHRLIYSDHRGYPLIGIARSDSEDETKASIWIGTNSQGFSIMNTMSYNLTEESISTNNGALMRRALEVCKNVIEFKYFLDTLGRPMKVSANYGVIDADGGAAYFETYTDGYFMIDVNDPSVAPNGYLVYTNFSYNGKYDGGQGYIRYQTASYIMAQGAPAKEFSPQWIFNNLSRSYYHSLLGVDLKSEEAMELFQKGFFPDSDFIPRKSTANSCVIQGVKKGENPELTTFWAVLGYPACSVAIPAWVKAGDDISCLLKKRDNTYNSKMCDMALILKANVFPVTTGNGEKYLDFSKIYNTKDTGYIQRLTPIENHIFEISNKKIENWRKTGIISSELKALTKEVCEYIENNFPKI
ncbi:MAG: carcinine hydrolase/isopenicillin-N N-acyltransferase family protein [Rikenellaceae bacterium]